MIRASFAVIRSYSALAFRLPGTTAIRPSGSGFSASGVSSRSPASRLFRSMPWQDRQFSARIGSTSRLKSRVALPLVAARTLALAPSTSSNAAGRLQPVAYLRIGVLISAVPSGAGDRWSGPAEVVRSFAVRSPSTTGETVDFSGVKGTGVVSWDRGRPRSRWCIVPAYNPAPAGLPLKVRGWLPTPLPSPTGRVVFPHPALPHVPPPAAAAARWRRG